MNWTLRIFAGAVDFFQFMVFVVFTALQLITPIGGAAAGGVAAASYCWTASSGVISGFWAAAKCAVFGIGAGGALSAFAIPLGMVLDVAISMIFGSAIILGLVMAGKFHADAVIQSFIGETIPLINFLPFWSIMVHRCITRDEAGAEGGVFSTTLSFAAGAATGGTSSVAGSAVALAGKRFANPAPTRATKEQPAMRAPALNTRIPSDIRRPANDNSPTSYANAA